MRRVIPVLLAGGRSARFGSDKAFFQQDGLPLWQLQVQKLRKACQGGKVLLSANASQKFPRDPNVEVVRDAWPDSGPQGGIATCLKLARTRSVLVLGVDLCDMTTEFLARTLENAEPGKGVAFTDGERWEPMVGIYPPVMLTAINLRLEAGINDLQSLLTDAVADDVMTRVEIDSEDRALFRNMNRPPEP